MCYIFFINPGMYNLRGCENLLMKPPAAHFLVVFDFSDTTFSGTPLSCIPEKSSPVLRNLASPKIGASPNGASPRTALN